MKNAHQQTEKQQSAKIQKNRNISYIFWTKFIAISQMITKTRQNKLKFPQQASAKRTERIGQGSTHEIGVPEVAVALPSLHFLHVLLVRHCSPKLRLRSQLRIRYLNFARKNTINTLWLCNPACFLWTPILFYAFLRTVSPCLRGRSRLLNLEGYGDCYLTNQSEENCGKELAPSYVYI